MAEERPQLPPPQVPIRGYTTPVNQEGFFSERVDYTAPEYRVIPRGTKYSTILGADPNVIDQFSELYFLRETREIGSYPWAMRFWATDTLAEDTYNSSVEYVSEAVTYPAYTRVYTVRRDSYEASTTLPIGGTLTSIIAIKVINGGQDYTQATITIDGVGSDATAEAVIDVDGTIASIVVTNCGQDYTSVPTVTITGDGGGAVAIAIIQPQTAYLVSQKKTEFPDEKQNTGGLAYMHPLKNEYVIITRIYETLPGPWVYSYKEDIDGALLTIKTRRNIGANIVTEEVISSSTWSDTTAKGVDNFVSEETNESRSIIIDDTTAGTATKMTTSRVDEDGKTVTVTRAQASAAYLASITTRETISTGVWKRITSEPISHLKVWMIVETRVLPGNAIPYTRLDDDGKIVTGTRTLKDESTITTVESLGGGTWTHTFKEKVGDLVAWQITEARPIPGNAMVTTRVEEDGFITTITKTMSDTTAVVSSEVISTGVWIKTHKEEISDLVAWKVVESRSIPGNPLVTTKIDEDGKPITITKTLGDTSLITSNEVISTGIWIRTYKEEVSDLVAYQVQESRAVPGNSVVTTKIDEDGKTLTTTKILKDTSTITSSESVGGGNWTRVFKEAVSDLVANEVTEVRPIPGNDIVKTVIDADGDIVTETRTMVVGPPTLVTTITTSGGVWTKTFGEPISDLVSWKVVQVKATQNTMDSYEVSIPDLLPREFAAGLPVTTHEDTLIGTASLPTLVTGDLMRKQQQIDFNTYRLTVSGRAGISLPQVITNKTITSQFGGGDVTETVTLNLFNSLTLDEGLMVLSSEIIHIDNVANGLAVKTSRIVDGVAWPILYQTHVDPKYDLIVNVQKQTVDAGTTGSVITNGTIEVQPHDKWKSIQFTSTFDLDSLPEDVVTYSGMQYSFVPELTDAVVDYAEAFCGCADSFSAILVANMNQYRGTVKTRVTEQFYDGPPPDDVTITQFFPQSHNFGFAWAYYCGCTEDGPQTTRSAAPKFYIPLCLHDDLSLNVGSLHVWTFPATNPAVLPHGDYIMLAPHIERWRFGVFRRVLIEVLVP